MKKIFPVLVALCGVVCACNNTVPAMDPSKTSSTEKSDNKDDKEDKSSDNTDSKEKTKPQLLNNISLETEGDVEVYRAFLAYESGDLVPSTNTTSLGKPIYVNLNITKGWQVENGMVALGAKEKISTDNGTVILDSDDLFTEPVKESDASVINLKALINNMTGPIKYFVVDFKVWDKNGNGVINGSYKFYIE